MVGCLLTLVAVKQQTRLMTSLPPGQARQCHALSLQAAFSLRRPNPDAGPIRLRPVPLHPLLQHTCWNCTHLGSESSGLQDMEDRLEAGSTGPGPVPLHALLEHTCCYSTHRYTQTPQSRGQCRLHLLPQIPTHS